MTQKISAGLLSCADKIWETADTLRGAGIKASDWPAYMMPFFALMMSNDYKMSFDALHNVNLIMRERLR